LNETIDRLRKILELEQSKGYRDMAVVGGLDRFLNRLTPPCRGLSDLLSQSYSSLDAAERERWVRELLRQLGDDAQRVSRPPVNNLAARQRSTPARRRVDAIRELDTPITSVRGVNSSLASKFCKLGVRTVRDMLYFFPHRHIDYSRTSCISQLQIGMEQTVVAHIWEAAERRMSGRRRATEAVVGDETGNVRVIWFNQPYMARTLKPNRRIVISGRVNVFRNREVFENPEWEFLDSDDLTHTGRLVPVYPLTAGLGQRAVRRIVKGALEACLPGLLDFLPESLRQRAGLMPLAEAVSQAHYPDSESAKDRARRRLAFDELLLIQLGVLSRRREWKEQRTSSVLEIDGSQFEWFLNALPFTLTGAQRRALSEIQQDLAKTKPMSRLLQGDVGSGKTVVATAAMLATATNGFQAALMAPTEILADQHFESISGLLSRASKGCQDDGTTRSFSSFLNGPVTVGLLHGGLRGKARQQVLERISSGDVNIVIGTHALIQKGVDFHSLGLAVVDEQHRFGVMQRHELRSKGSSPHVLVMSATPIPRTLALTLYGDLDLSIIDELPPGRAVIKTRKLKPGQRERACEFVRRQVTEGRQAFIICPLIEESEAIDTKAAIAEFQRLSQDVFPDLRLGLLHGRLSSSEKDGVMQRFRGGELDILVSTPVVEVGVDVPNATVMLIEGADRFGLAQLHQFRGRVGRGEHQSYCILLAETPSAEAEQRLSLVEEHHDGFKLAEKDLELRGPGEFFGTRQSGLPELKMARLSDMELLELARNEAKRLFDADPYLQSQEHGLLAGEVSRLWESGGEKN
jgi:ATP-dependent DNA helicase RecG